MGLFDVEPKKTDTKKEATHHAPIGAKGLQFVVQGEPKRSVASGDSTEFEATLKVMDDGQPHSVAVKVDTVFAATEEGAPEWFVKLFDPVGIVWENTPSADQVKEKVFEIMPGEEKSLTLKITSPTGARFGDKITVLVSANLTDDLSVNDTMTLQATARQSIMAIKTSIGHEKTVADSVASRAKPKPIGVFAILSPATIRGYVFVEAMNTDALRDVVKGVRRTRGMVKGETTFAEIEHFLTPKPIVSGIVEGDIVELIAGPFKGEKARVQQIDESKEQITVELFEAMVPIPVTIRGDHVRVLEKEK
ncbi:MAG: Transcription elongation factor Spt5 [Candidatus Thermoplasmatota archaeon]|nr:Transcription elongation factor Spt5 [Candidatus Thermoplasmatota archaeon]